MTPRAPASEREALEAALTEALDDKFVRGAVSPQSKAKLIADFLDRALAAHPTPPPPLDLGPMCRGGTPDGPCDDETCEAHDAAATPPPPLDAQALADAIAEVLPVPSMLDVDFAEDTAHAILAALPAATPSPDAGEPLRALSEAATPGPWVVVGDVEYVTVGSAYNDEEVAVIGTPNQYTEADAALIVAAVNYVRALLDGGGETDEDHGWEAYKDAFPAGKNIVESGGEAPAGGGETEAKP